MLFIAQRQLIIVCYRMRNMLDLVIHYGHTFLCLSWCPLECIRETKDDKSNQKDLLHIPQQQSKRKEVESLDFLSADIVIVF